MEKITFFMSFTSCQPSDSSLDNVAELIRSNKQVASVTDAYRLTGNKAVKSRSPLFAVACHFKGGKSKDNIVGITGLSLCDFDHVAPERMPELMHRIRNDPHTLLAYTTISGKGLRIIFRYEMLPDATPPTLAQQMDHYKKAFFTGNRYYEQLLQQEADMQCKNITRLSGIAHDPEVVLREDAVAFGLQEISEASSQQEQWNKSQRQRRRIQAYYDTAIAPCLKSEGICFAPGHHNEYVMRVGYMLAEKRFNFQTALQWASEQFSAYDDVRQVFTSCFASRKQEADRSAPSPKRSATVGNIRKFLDDNIMLRYNEVTMRVEYVMPPPDDKTPLQETPWRPISDRVVNTLWVNMSESMTVHKPDLYSVIESDHIPVFNPFASYLDGLPAADGTDYIMQLAQTIRVRGDDDQQLLWYRYLKKWLVAMVASWLHADVVNNVILVLIGEQGSYKTTWFSRLLPPCLQQYFYTKTNSNRMGRDDQLVLTQYALVCCEELDTMRPAELNQLKAIVTTPSINERAAYARYHECRQHIASFCGTGNNRQFLTDTTGNRRWLPFEVEHIVSPREHPLPYDGIYAQALHLLRSDFRYWFNKEEIQEQYEHNKQFEAPRLEVELVDLYFRKPTEHEVGVFISVARALQIVSLNISQKLSPVNIGRAFVELGFERMRTKQVRGFIAIIRTAEEIKAYQYRMSYVPPDDALRADDPSPF